jgi:hypothetical protein
MEFHDRLSLFLKDTLPDDGLARRWRSCYEKSRSYTFKGEVSSFSCLVSKASGLEGEQESGNSKHELPVWNSALEIETRNEKRETPKLLSGSGPSRVDGGISGART